MTLYHLLNGRNYGTYNRAVAHEIGLLTTIVLSELLDKYQFFKAENKLSELKGEEGLWFYVTVDEFEYRTSLSDKEQNTRIKKLIRLGFIEKRVRNSPPVRYFKINEEAIHNFLLNLKNDYHFLPNGGIDSSQTAELIPPKRMNSPIYKNLSKEPKEREGALPPSDPPFPQFISGNVKMDAHKHAKLMSDFGAALVDRFIEELDLYSQTRPKEFKKYACHAAVIRTWIKREANNSSKSPNASNSALEAPQRDLREIVTENRCWTEKLLKTYAEAFRGGVAYASSEYLQFTLTNDQQYKIFFKDHKFRDLVRHELTKRGIG
jgi:hypothetical protein